jgi:hypothetical protein
MFMPADPSELRAVNRVEPFLDNWTHLKVELNWLERLLLLAVARARKESKDVERVAQTKADRATSHWWKGMISLDGSISYDSPPERRKVSPEESQGNYQQQIEARIRASQQHGIVLALPRLCDRLNLTSFEKNVILLGIAPEVHRRYAQLYGYLRTGREGNDLPSVDLALRLFCRDDTEWREARSCLTESSALIQHQLVELEFSPSVPLLNRTFKLADRLVDYLLATSPQFDGVEHLLERHLPSDGGAEAADLEWVQVEQGAIAPPIGSLVLPDELMETLHHLGDRLQFCTQVDEEWGFAAVGDDAGSVALMVGAAGTGKATAARMLADRSGVPLMQIDLAMLTPSEQVSVLQQITAQSPTVLLVKSAELWLKKSAAVASGELARLLQKRRSSRCLTFLSVRKLPAIPAEVRSQLHHTLNFPIPDPGARLQLWKQAFAPQVPLGEDIDWQWLAKTFALTGGEIGAIARSAAFFAAADSTTPQLGMLHLMKALKGMKMKGSVNQL